MSLTLIGTNTDEVRAEWVIKQLKALPKGSKILDAGAGELRFKPYCTHLNYVAQDFAKYDGGGDGLGLQTGAFNYTKLDIVSDITRIPVDDQSFDAVLCTEVFEHLPNALGAVREFSRILKPDGALLITAPFCSLTHFAPYHFGGLNRYWYTHHFPSLGLSITELSANGSWFAFVAQELRRSRLVGRMYSSALLGLVTRIAAIPLIVLLTLLSRWDRGSEELLCFGYMIKAVKQPGSTLAKSTNAE